MKFRNIKMKYIIRRGLALVLSVVLVGGMIPAIPAYAATDPEWGSYVDISNTDTADYLNYMYSKSLNSDQFEKSKDRIVALSEFLNKLDPSIHAITASEINLHENKQIKWHPSQSDIDSSRDLYLLEWVNGNYSSNPGSGYEVKGRIIYLAEDGNIYYTPQVNIDDYPRKLAGFGDKAQWDQGRINQALFAMPEDCMQILGVLMCNESGSGNNDNSWWMDTCYVSRITSDNLGDVSYSFTNEKGFKEFIYENGKLVGMVSDHDITKRYLGADGKNQEWLYLLQTPVAQVETGVDYYAQIVTTASSDLSDKEFTLEIDYTTVNGSQKTITQVVSDDALDIAELHPGDLYESYYDDYLPDIPETTYPTVFSGSGYGTNYAAPLARFWGAWPWYYQDSTTSGVTITLDHLLRFKENIELFSAWDGRMANEIALEWSEDRREKGESNSIDDYLGSFHDFRWEDAYMSTMNATAVTYFGNYVDTQVMKESYLGGYAATDVKLDIPDYVASVDAIRFRAISGEVQDVRIYAASPADVTRTKLNGGLSVERVFADASDSKCLAYLDKMTDPDGNTVAINLTGTTINCTPESENDRANRRLIVNSNKAMNFYDVNDNLGVLISIADVLDAGIELFATDYVTQVTHPKTSNILTADRLYSTNHLKSYLLTKLDWGKMENNTALELINVMESYFKESLTLTVTYVDSFGAIRQVQVPVVTTYMLQLYSDNDGYLGIASFDLLSGVFQQGDDISIRLPLSQYDHLMSVELGFGSSPRGINNFKNNKYFYTDLGLPVHSGGFMVTLEDWLANCSDDYDSNTALKKELAEAFLPEYETFKDGTLLPTSETISIRYIRIYEHVNKDNFKSVYNRQKRIAEFSTDINSSYYFAASNKNGQVFANGQSLKLSLTDGTLLIGTIDLTERDLENLYVVEINGQKISSEAKTPEDIEVTFAYTTTGGEQVVVENKKLSELAKSFNGYASMKGLSTYPTMDERQLAYDLGRNTVKYLLELDNVSSFDYISLGLLDGVTVGWQVNSVGIYSLTELSHRYSNIRYLLNDMPEFDRDFEGDLVALNNKPAALQPGQTSKTFYFSKVLEDGTIETPDTDISYKDEYITVPPTSMSYQETLKNLGLAITKYTYTVDVDVANIMDAGSSNYFYFQLVFENGTSGVVLANQQLAADSFRQGYTESFTIHTTQNYGNVTGIRIICDTSSSDSKAFDKLNISKITVSLPSNGGAKSWIMDKVGWIDINYQDEGAATVASDKKNTGFPNSMVVKEFARTRTASTARLLFNISTAASSPAYSGGADSDYEAALTYVDSAGYTQTYNFNLKTAIFNYIENTSWTNLFRPNMSDYFTLSLNDVTAVKSLSIYRANGVGDWIIKDISISQFSDLGDVYMDTTGEFKRYVENETLITTSVNAEQTVTRTGNATFTFSDHTININTSGTNPEGWTTTITRLPVASQETLNFYVYPGSSHARTYTFDANNPLQLKGRVEYTFKDNGATIGSESFTFTETTDINGVTVLKATGIKVNGMNQLKSLYLLSETSDLPIISGVQVERIRGNTIVERLYFNYNNETLTQGRTYSATAKSDTSASRTKQTLALQVSNGQSQIFGTNNDVAVALLYTNENDASSKQKTVYSSPYVFFTDVGITSLGNTSILEIPFEETGVDQVVGFSIVSNGADITFDNALIYNYLTKPAGEAVLIDSCPITEKISTSTVAKQHMEKANASVTPVTLTFTTSADSKYQGAGSSGRLPLTINYKNTSGNDASVSYDNFLNLLPANTVPSAGSTVSVKVQLTNLDSLTSLFISATDDDWHLYKVSAAINQIVNALQIPQSVEAFVDNWITSTKPATAVFGNNTQSKIVNFSLTGLTTASGNVETATSGNVLKIKAVPGETVSFIPSVTVEGTPDTSVVWDTSQYSAYIVDGGAAGLDFRVPDSYHGVSSVGQAFTFACYCSFDTDKTITVTIEVVEPTAETPDATPEPEIPETTEETVVSGTLTPDTGSTVAFELRDGESFTHYVDKGSANAIWTFAATSSVTGHSVEFTPASIVVNTATTGVYTTTMICLDENGEEIFDAVIKVIVVDKTAGMTLSLTGEDITVPNKTVTFADNGSYYEYEVPAGSKTYAFTAIPTANGNTVAIKDKNGAALDTTVNITSELTEEKLLKELVVVFTETGSGESFSVNVRVKTSKNTAVSAADVTPEKTAVTAPVKSVLGKLNANDTITDLVTDTINAPNSTAPARYSVSKNITYTLTFAPLDNSNANVTVVLDTNNVAATIKDNTVIFNATAEAGTVLFSARVICKPDADASGTETVHYFEAVKTT